jgi:hypothetical protein
MKTRRVIALSVFAGATFSAAVGLSVASEDTQTAPGATASPLARQGRLLFCRRAICGEPGQTPHGRTVYVEYLTPRNVTCPYPIIMIHGTAQTGTIS